MFNELFRGLTFFSVLAAALSRFRTAEICSSAFYRGRDKHCLVSNALFRMGGCAALLTSGASQRGRSKYQLTHSERVHTGRRDTGYK